jgi:hypothetical protein
VSDVELDVLEAAVIVEELHHTELIVANALESLHLVEDLVG